MIRRAPRLPLVDVPLTVSELAAPRYTEGDVSIPAVSVSAARAADGSVLLALVNTDPGKAARVTANVSGAAPTTLRARVLTAPRMNAHNTFEEPGAVVPAPFTAAARRGEAWVLDLPAKSVVVAVLD